MVGNIIFLWVYFPWRITLKSHYVTSHKLDLVEAGKVFGYNSSSINEKNYHSLKPCRLTADLKIIWLISLLSLWKKKKKKIFKKSYRRQRKHLFVFGLVTATYNNEKKPFLHTPIHKQIIHRLLLSNINLTNTAQVQSEFWLFCFCFVWQQERPWEIWSSLRYMSKTPQQLSFRIKYYINIDYVSKCQGIRSNTLTT